MAINPDKLLDAAAKAADEYLAKLGTTETIAHSVRSILDEKKRELILAMLGVKESSWHDRNFKVDNQGQIEKMLHTHAAAVVDQWKGVIANIELKPSAKALAAMKRRAVQVYAQA